MLRMTVEGVAFDQKHDTVVVLKDWEGRKLLPIWIGASEAKAIALELENTRPQRPLSHDLLLSCIASRGGKVTRIVINDLQDSTFYATIDIDTPDGMRHIDSRPSDAIALAVRARCPVFVDGGALSALVELKDVTTLEGETTEAEPEDALEKSLELSNNDHSDTPPDAELERFQRLIGDLDLQE